MEIKEVWYLIFVVFICWFVVFVCVDVEDDIVFSVGESDMIKFG